MKEKNGAVKHLHVVGKATIYVPLYGACIVRKIQASLYQDGSAVHTEIDSVAIQTTWYPRGRFYRTRREAVDRLRRYLKTEIEEQESRLLWLRKAEAGL